MTWGQGVTPAPAGPSLEAPPSPTPGLIRSSVERMQREDWPVRALWVQRGSRPWRGWAARGGCLRARPGEADTTDRLVLPPEDSGESGCEPYPRAGVGSAPQAGGGAVDGDGAGAGLAVTPHTCACLLSTSLVSGS